MLGQDKPKDVFYCMRSPPGVQFVPAQSRVQGAMALTPLSSFPVVDEGDVCGEFLDASDVAHA